MNDDFDNRPLKNIHGRWHRYLHWWTRFHDGNHIKCSANISLGSEMVTPHQLRGFSAALPQKQPRLDLYIWPGLPSQPRLSWVPGMDWGNKSRMHDSYHNTHLGSIGQMKYGSSNIYRIWEKTINQIWEQHHLSNTEEDHTPHMGATPYTKYGRRPYTEYGSSTIYLGAPYTWQQHHIPNMLKSCRKHFFTFVCCYVKHWLNLIHTCFTKWWKSFLKHGSISRARAHNVNSCLISWKHVRLSRRLAVHILKHEGQKKQRVCNVVHARCKSSWKCCLNGDSNTKKDSL